MNILTKLCLVGIVTAGVALASPADAQTIRTYGDQSSDSSSSSGGGGNSSGSGGGAAWYPGMPKPSSGNQSGSQGQQQAGQQKKEGGEEGEEVHTTYKVRMYGSSPQSASGPRTTLDLAVDKMYRGVIPGKRDEVDHLNEERDKGVSSSSANRMTWLGFQPEDSRTRIFIQTSREADYEQSMNQEQSQMTLTLYNSKFSAKNFSRFVDTSYFDRNVQRIEAKEQDGTIKLHVKLQEMERPSVQQNGNYLYIDFPFESADESGDDSSGGQ